MDKKVMVVCGNWYPKPMPVTICAINVIRELKAVGYEVTVCSLSEDMDAHGMIEENGVKVYQRLPLLEQRLMYYATKKNNKWLYSVGVLFSRLHSLLLLPFYPRDAFLLYTIWSREISNLMEQEGIKNIISFENPTEASWVAYNIKRKKKDIKWINYQIDCGANTEKGSSFYCIRKIMQKKVDKAYKRMMKLADCNIIMKTHINHYIKAGFGAEQIKIRELDIPLINTTVAGKKNIVKNFDKWVYAGALSTEWYNPSVLIDFFMEYIKYNVDATLCIWGYADENAKKVLDKAEKASNGRIIYKGYVSHSIIEKELDKADVLIYYMSAMKKSVSGKFFEYISFAKPIIYLSPGKGDVNETYVNKYIYGTAISSDISVEEQAADAREFLKKMHSKVIDSQDVIDCFKDNNPKEAALYIDSIFTEKEGNSD